MEDSDHSDSEISIDEVLKVLTSRLKMAKRQVLI
jgi:hypothetical protein